MTSIEWTADGYSEAALTLMAEQTGLAGTLARRGWWSTWSTSVGRSTTVCIAASAMSTSVSTSIATTLGV